MHLHLIDVAPGTQHRSYRAIIYTVKWIRNKYHRRQRDCAKTSDLLGLHFRWHGNQLASGSRFHGLERTRTRSKLTALYAWITVKSILESNSRCGQYPRVVRHGQVVSGVWLRWQTRWEWPNQSLFRLEWRYFQTRSIWYPRRCCSLPACHLKGSTIRTDVLCTFA